MAEVRDEGVLLQERPGLEMSQLTAWPTTAAQTREAVSALLGLEPPSKPNTVSQLGPLRILSVGPYRWMIVRPATTPSLTDELRARLTREIATTVELGAARCVLAVSGKRSRDVLARHLPLDLSEAAFPAGRCAQSAVGSIGVLIHAETHNSFSMYAYRSFARHLSEMLADTVLAL